MLLLQASLGALATTSEIISEELPGKILVYGTFLAISLKLFYVGGITSVEAEAQKSTVTIFGLLMATKVSFFIKNHHTSTGSPWNLYSAKNLEAAFTKAHTTNDTLQTSVWTIGHFVSTRGALRFLFSFVSELDSTDAPHSLQGTSSLMLQPTRPDTCRRKSTTPLHDTYRLTAHPQPPYQLTWFHRALVSSGRHGLAGS